MRFYFVATSRSSVAFFCALCHGGAFGVGGVFCCGMLCLWCGFVFVVGFVVVARFVLIVNFV